MEVILQSSAKKELDRLPSKLGLRISLAIRGLQEEPFPTQSKKLQGWVSHYRLRVGDYRVIYFWDKVTKKILITKVKHRREVYK